MRNYQDYNIDAPDTGTGEYRTICPECSPHRKNQNEKDLSVNLTAKTWYCHHCGWTGGISESEPTRTTRPLQAKFEVLPMQTLNHEAIEYLAKRGISEATAKDAGLKSCRTYFHKLGREAEAIAFPIFDDAGQIVNVKYRCIQAKDFTQSKGGNQSRLFCGQTMAGNDTIIISEGELDTLSILEAGYFCAASCPNGAPPPNAKDVETKLKFIDANREAFSAADRIILAMDKDEPGIAFEKIIAERIGLAKCYSVQYPAECKDANECLVKYGVDQLRECIRNAAPFPVDGVTTFRDHAKAIMDYRTDRGRSRLFSTGIRAIDKCFQLERGTLNILTGIPSHGKSELLDQLIVNTAKIHGWKWALYSPENYPLENHFRKLAEKWLQKPFFNPDNNTRWSIPAMTESEAADAIDDLSKHTHILTLTESGATLDNILSRIEYLHKSKGLNAFVIDPWNEIDHQRPAAQTETEYISAALSRIRNFARLNNLSAWIIAHPAKLLRDKSGNYPIPTPYDISGSAHWRNKADVCLTVWRNVMEGTDLQLHIQKIRNRQAGYPAVVNLNWQPATGTISAGYETPQI